MGRRTPFAVKVLEKSPRLCSSVGRVWKRVKEELLPRGGTCKLLVPSYVPKKKSLFFFTGPPADAPKMCSRKGNGSAAKKFLALKALCRWNSHSVPWY